LRHPVEYLLFRFEWWIVFLYDNREKNGNDFVYLCINTEHHNLVIHLRYSNDQINENNDEFYDYDNTNKSNFNLLLFIF